MNLRLPQLPNKPTKRTYTIWREVSLIWQQVDASIDLIAAVLFGMEKWEWAVSLWIIGMLSSYINSKIYFWLQEQIGKDKVKYGKKNGNGKFAKKIG